MNSQAKVRPFSCGSQLTDWLDRNCDHCTKSPRGETTGPYTAICEIEQALDDSFYSGTVSHAMALRMGVPESGVRYLWDCPERQNR